jgi:hypothetical protein
MISFAGLGEAIGEGEVTGVGDTAGVGAVLGVVMMTGVEGVADGEFEACWLGSAQPDNAKTNPATKVAGNPPLLTRP